VERRHWRREPEFLEAHGIKDGDGSKLSRADRLQLLAHFREDELEADALAVVSLKRAKYSAKGLVRVLRLFDTIEKMAGVQILSPALRTHPETSSRLKALGARGEADGELRQPEYLARVDGILFGDDPREGYLYGERYVNPQADLELVVPAPWRSLLLGHDLLAALPGKATVAILTHSEHGSVEETAHALGDGFAEMQVGGRRALSRRSVEEGGVVARMLILETHAGPYVLAAIAPAEDEKSPAVESILSGGKPISEPALKEIRPLRVRVLRLERDTTLRELQKDKPSRTNLDTLGLVNGAAPDEKLAAGSEVKRIDE
jgi:predicted Zn-dependent protease